MFNLKAKAKKALAERKKLKAIEKEAYTKEKAKVTAAKKAKKLKSAEEKGRKKASGELRKERVKKVIKGATALRDRLEQMPDTEQYLKTIGMSSIETNKPTKSNKVSNAKYVVTGYVKQLGKRDNISKPMSLTKAKAFKRKIDKEASGVIPKYRKVKTTKVEKAKR